MEGKADSSTIINAIELTAKILAEIKDISLDSDTLEEVTSKVLELIKLKPSKQYTPGNTQLILDCIRQHNGCATRSQIASTTGMNPNTISSLLNKLVKKGTIYKIPFDQLSPSKRKGSGLIADYAYQLSKLK